ncbi:Phospholipid:diacylglycerol acyltransferase [Fimicolochytrium jonesii]|uniref:Phospholipid:diacylglycerol acyltransferase n=1 Tax=Fimicolochytrium jonesii TaxID=1396493 RepID=UPI0022FDC21C|nr:Phospholipid:diacylglycerol acyltransferase [Fimicolochytrium jonesii]KAI8819358.1 Phospholipid:diacylglycerol acyltransferase [Fimicolochytrium jonesii]
MLPFRSRENADIEYGDFLPGARLAREGLQVKHPVVLIPGIVSTGLEVWNTAPETKFFRKRMWGTLDQIKALLLNKDCWMQHMMLDENGKDPVGVKLRAAQGLDSADFLFPGFWVWAKIIANLGSIGYDSNNMHLAAYDWRLSFKNLELRDLYFTKLKSTIEIAYKHAIMNGGDENAAKVMIASHSMGSTVFLYFINWIRAQHGDEWNAKYLAGWINIAGTLLGVPKAAATLLSGEMRDTAQLNAAATSLLDYFFSREQRVKLFRSWGGMASMLPYGGEALWGNAFSFAPDELHSDKPSFGAMVDVGSSPTDSRTSDSKSSKPKFHLTASNMTAFIDHHSKDGTELYWSDDYSYGIAKTKEQLQDSKKDSRAWTNPLLTPLPKFGKNFKIVCLYGTGLQTERKYFYKLETPSDGTRSNNDTFPEEGNADMHIDQSQSDAASNTVYGVQTTDGDGTVPLLSLGYMCQHGWKQKRYNPEGVTVITRETREDPSRRSGILNSLPKVRGGPDSPDHVDILGNYELTEDILRLVSGQDENVVDRIYSEIDKISERVVLPPHLD